MRWKAAAVTVLALSAACGGTPAAPTRTNSPPSPSFRSTRGFGELALRPSPDLVEGAGDSLTRVPDLALCLQSTSSDCFSSTIQSVRGAAAVAPGPPGTLVASSAGGTVMLTWSPPSSGDAVFSYVIEAGSASGAADLASFSTGSSATSFTASAIPNGVYYVRVRGVSEGGVGAAGNEATLTVGGDTCVGPGAPTGLTLVSNSGGTVVLAWSPGSGMPTSFLLEAGSASGQSDLANTDVGSTTTMTATGVAAGTYYVRVRARNACGTSVSSAEITLTVSSAADPAPVLSVPIVDLAGSYDPVTKRMGALNCTFTFGTDPNDRWCFNAFGSSAVPGKQGVSYDYKVVAGATVFAAAAGTVFRVEAETSAFYPNEFEIETRASSGGSYSVIYDHVKNLTVGLGSIVQPGMALGTAGIHTTNPSVWGRVELQINRITERTPVIRGVSLCPRAFGTAAFNQLNDAALAAHNLANAPYAAASVCLTEQIGSN